MAQDSSRPEFWDVRYRDGVTPWEPGAVPARLLAFVATLAPGSRVLVPGCGSGHEVPVLAAAGMDVVGLDFSDEAVARARSVAGPHADRIVQGDFFVLDPGPGFDVLVERAFLCALPRALRETWARQVATLLRPGGLLAGYWFHGEGERGPPFGIAPADLKTLLEPHFTREQDETVPEHLSLPVFAGRERWGTWRRRA